MPFLLCTLFLGKQDLGGMIDAERNVLMQTYQIEQKIVNVLDSVDNYEKLELKLVLAMTMIQTLIYLVK